MSNTKCLECGDIFNITEQEEVYIKKNNIPKLNKCSLCNWQHQLAFWPSVGKWYKRKCDFSGETIITNYPDDSRFPVYKKEIFDGDKWKIPKLEVNLNESFFEQIKTLQEKTPRPHMNGIGNENCNYCDDTWNCKNCFLAVSQGECENLFYSYRNLKCNNSSNIIYCYNCEMCTNLTYCHNSYKLSYSSFSKNCKNSRFLYDCENCEESFMCWNLRNKKYNILNKQYDKKEYKKKISEINMGSYKEMLKIQKIFEKNIKENALIKENVNEQAEKSSGNYLLRVSNTKNSFFTEDGKDNINLFRSPYNNNCINSVGNYILENSYMCGECVEGYNLKFCTWSIRCSNSEYLDNCINCSNCFLCVGLKDKKFCILNKQHTKEEYEKLTEKIRAKMMKDGEYGNFFPYNMMYSGYNTTLARFYFPKTKEKIEDLGGYWEDFGEIKIPGELFDLPDNIKDISHQTTGAIKCKKSGEQFNYIKEVIELYKKLNIPLEPITHLERIKKLFKPLTYIKPYKGKCYLTQKDILHYYPPELGFKKIISKEAYEKEIY